MHSACSIPRRNRWKNCARNFPLICKTLAETRPTAVDLFWAIERFQRRFAGLVSAASATGNGAASLEKIRAALIAEAQLVHEERRAGDRRIGKFGAELMPKSGRVMTQCNAGALATGGIGTALGVIRMAIEAGHKIEVLVPETRPYLQGARLTAWELHEDGIPLTLITDNMVGHFLRTGAVGAVVVGADRIAANGDTANKIGTYGMAVLAKENNVPFYVAAPISTIDLTLKIRRPDPDRGALATRSDAPSRHPPSSKCHRSAPGLRRNPSPLHQRHNHRTRHRPPAVQRIASTRGNRGLIRTATSARIET